VILKLHLQKLALAIAVLVIGAQPAFSQNYPLPGKASAAPVICAQCDLADGKVTKNLFGQNNTGLKTWPYSSPLKNHVGRVLDSTIVTDFQGGFRTGRAQKIRFAKTQRGSVQPRAYVQIGSAVAAYNLSTFFTTTLPAGPVEVNALASVARNHRGDYPYEKIARWDAYIYPEDDKQWVTPSNDGQDRLEDFDFDDRGYVYFSSGSLFGFGIVRDTGQTGSGILPLVKQVLPPLALVPETIVAVKDNSKYYAIISGAAGRHTYDVTNPANPVAGLLKTTTVTTSYYIKSYAKDETRGVVAILTGADAIEMWENGDLATGGSPIATFAADSDQTYFDVTVDENGNFWSVRKQGTSSVIVKFTRNGSGYTETAFNVFGQSFEPAGGSSERVINYSDKYLAVVGKLSIDTGVKVDVVLFKIESGEPVLVDLHNFFARYYHGGAPRDYAGMPSPQRVATTGGAYPIKWNNKTYLIYQAYGIGDVFELEAGDSISASKKSTKVGHSNPNAKSVEAGPFYGDILQFAARSSNPSFEYNVQWNFGNPEATSAVNVRQGRTGSDHDLNHQFTGLNTTDEISAPKQVTVHALSDTSMADAVTVNLAVPVARIGVKGTDVVVTSNNQDLPLVVGDELTDASDGEIEGHYSVWKVGSQSTNKKPDETLVITDVGPGSVDLTARYGTYDTNFATTGAPFSVAVTGLDYVARPFIAAFRAATTSGTSVTFKGEARKTTLTSVLSASTWTVEWTLKNDGTDVVPPQTSTVAVGTVPDFPVANKSVITSGSILTLRVSVDPSGLSQAAAAYAEHSVTQELVTPDPKITKSGCANTGAPCTLTVSSIGGKTTSDWNVKWTLKVGATTKLGTGLTYTPSLTEPGSHLVSVVVTNKLFEGTATLPVFPVAGPVCGDPPTADQLAIFASCTNNCPVNDAITFRADPWAYSFQGCEEFQWSFSDGTVATTSARSTTKGFSSSGTKTVKLKVKKGTQLSPEFSVTVAIAGVIPPPPRCDIPSGIVISYTGDKGCKPGTPCKTTEKVTFSAKRGPGPLNDCDTVAWTFHDGSTSASRAPNKTFSTASPGYTVSVIVSNTKGQDGDTVSVPVVVDNGPTSCTAPPTDRQVYVDYVGKTSGCSSINPSMLCRVGETIELKAVPFSYSVQTCDKFEWDFGDGSAKVTTTQATTHVYTGSAASYRAAVRVYNTANSTGTTVSQNLPFSTAPVLPTPVLSYAGFPSKGAKGSTVTFRVNSNIPATGWEWTFGDGSAADRSQASVVGNSSVITHTFTKTGTFAVTAKARNKDDSTNAPVGVATGNITVDETPEFRYLLPVVTHIGGQGGSSWRTDVQLYYPDPNVSPENRAHATATLRNIEIPLDIYASTMIFEDFMQKFTLGNDAGPVIITVRGVHAPQIWTRTYNQTEAGTFGQFIPAIRLDAAGGGSGFGEGKYYLSGLRSDARFRSNIGFVNPSAVAMNVTIRVYDDERMPLGQFVRTLNPYALDQVNDIQTKVPGITGERPYTLEVEVPAGQWLIAYASLIDNGSSDPVFIQAVRESELASVDNKELIIPGVGHAGAWRSDVTLFNPDAENVSVDLEYYDGLGVKLGEAKSIPIGHGEFLQYEDILKQGIFGNVTDGVGMLRVKVLDSPIPNTRFPMAFARTYNDNGSGRTYGQGIGGVAVAKANLKPGRPALIPAIRSNTKYYTNIGVTNVSSTPAVVTVKMLDPTNGSESVLTSISLASYQSVVGRLNLNGIERASLKLEVTGGNVWAFASIIDQGTFDPEYIPATPLAQ
jgi:PKD repeat protein